MTGSLVLGALGTASAQEPVEVCTQASKDSADAKTDASAADACIKRCEGVEGGGAATRLKKCRDRLAAIRRDEAERQRKAEAAAEAERQRKAEAAAEAERQRKAEAAAEAERQRRRASPIELAYVTIPGGTFKMGSEKGDPDEKPVHDARVETFELMKTEVSVAQYEECVKAKECTPRTTVHYAGYSAEDAAFWSKSCNSGRADRADHPMNCVAATDAEAFCAWAGGARLPTETEWEFAARGKEGRPYPWGPQPPDATRVNACGAECVEWAARNGKRWAKLHDGHDGWSTTAPVSSFPKGATPEGVLHLSGNVWEWTASSYCDYPSKKCAEAARVIRGGCWFNSVAAWLRGAFRFRYSPSLRFVYLGFRCAR
ncbi:formylglycine-generating enzyme family protein [Myxococcota bacterium]|nr:formylglycine-generating enzyme family protein [Myxococcota bacterium]